ncbi:MAG: DUF2341 domain-containing protein, partial [Candidatus Thorarchaeota archaeon]
RFTDDNGTTLLDYWMEDYIESGLATFWVEVADDLDTDVTIYMYYGNQGTTSESDGKSTFLLFDDFEGELGESPDNETWNISVYTDGLSLDGMGNLTLESETTTTRSGIGSKTNFGPYDVTARSKVWSSGNYYRTMRLGSFRGDDVDHVDWYTNSWTNGIRFSTFKDGVMTQSDAVVGSFTGWNVYETSWYEGHGILTQNGVEYFHHTTNIPDQVCHVSANEPHDAGSDYVKIDYILVRKSLLNEPTHGIWGEEESKWLDGWDYRIGHTILQTNGAGTNYPISIIVYYCEDSPLDDTLYCGYNCQSDFDDIRFTMDDGVTPLDFWLEKFVEESYAIFWVEIQDDLTIDDSTFYVYFGNVEVDTKSNGEETFLFFDDFSNSTMDWNERWYSTDQEEYVIDSGILQCDYSSTDGILRTMNNFSENTQVHYRLRNQNADHTMYTHYSDNPDTMNEFQINTNTKFVSSDQTGADGTLAYFSNISTYGSPDVVDTLVDWNPVQWIDVTLALNQSYVYLEAVQNEVTWSTKVFNAKDGYDRYFKVATGLPSDIYIDYVFIGKFISSESLHGQWTELETAIEPTTSTQTTTTSTSTSTSTIVTTNSSTTSYTAITNTTSSITSPSTSSTIPSTNPTTTTSDNTTTSNGEYSVWMIFSYVVTIGSTIVIVIVIVLIIRNRQ